MKKMQFRRRFSNRSRKYQGGKNRKALADRQAFGVKGEAGEKVCRTVRVFLESKRGGTSTGTSQSEGGGQKVEYAESTRETEKTGQNPVACFTCLGGGRDRGR